MQPALHIDRSLCPITIVSENMSFVMVCVNRRPKVAYGEEEEMVAVLVAPPLMTLFFLLGLGTWSFFFFFLHQDDPEAVYWEGFMVTEKI